jgi:predicted NACHT family NTPase
LARLFFDLPASNEQRLLPPDEKPDKTGKLPPGVLWELLRDGSRKLDPKTVYEQEIASPDSTDERFPTRYVLLGGPGSGKSTVGQFLAQIHRAALLDRREPHLLGPQTRKIIVETRALCDQEGLPWPATPRYPFRVELNRYAKALAAKDSDRIESLGRYLLYELKREHTLTYEGLLEWLAMHPWLLILDGLDEVPATSNRDALVKAVNDFLAEARQIEANLFVVATSRQQGYGGEFASGAVAFRHILPLSTTRALRYVERYAEARFRASNPNRARDLVDKLRQSAKRELTAQLISSPLQVTFMATVVAARGDPGEDRWQLFDSYYRTIYDRERQKAVPPYDAVLSKQQPIIDRLHHDIGFWLQYQRETAGGTTVSLPIAMFERLVDAYLSEVGREGVEKDQMV